MSALTVVTVSYTHLDVYKRQKYICVFQVIIVVASYKRLDHKVVFWATEQFFCITFVRLYVTAAVPMEGEEVGVYISNGHQSVK